MVLCCARVGHHLSLATLRHSGRVERDTPRIGDTVDLLRRGVRVYRIACGSYRWIDFAPTPNPVWNKHQVNGANSQADYW
jgi:hypothetical protein